MKDEPSARTLESGPSLWDRLQDENDYPLSVLVSLTDRCPLVCGHCYITDRSKSGELNTSELCALFKELASLGTLRLTLTGGEVGLRDDLLELVEEAHRLKFALILKTSAALFEPRDLKTFKSAGVDEIHVSLYHSKEERHDAFVGMRGAWKKAVEALDLFRDLGGVVRASSVAMSWNVDDIAALVNLCESHRWKYAIDPRLVCFGYAKNAHPNLRVSREALVLLLSDPRLVPRGASKKSAGSPVCSAGLSAAYVDPRGDVSSCPDLPIVWGNIRRQSFAKIWKESPHRKNIREILEWGRSAPCMTCRHLSFCSRCPGDAFVEHGDLEKPATFDCLLAEVVGQNNR